MLFFFVNRQKAPMGALRLWLAIIVTLEHFGWSGSQVISGELAVNLFFTISGYYMALVLSTRYPATRSGLLQFYTARYLRLWPAYIVTFVILLLFVRPMLSIAAFAPITQAYVWFVSTTMVGYESLQWFMVDRAAGAVTVAKTVEMGSDGLMTLDMLPYMRHMWSIGIEIVFYALAPLFARDFRRTLIALAISVVAYAVVSTSLDFYHPIRIRSIGGYAPFFVLGVAAYHVAQQPWAARVLPKWPVSSYPITLTLTAAMVLSFMALHEGGILHPVVIATALAIVIPGLFAASRKFAFDRSIGELSYPMYVAHWPIASLLLRQHSGDPAWTVAVVALSLLAGIALQVLVVLPVERIRVQFTNPEEAAPLGPKHIRRRLRYVQQPKLPKFAAFPHAIKVFASMRGSRA